MVEPLALRARFDIPLSLLAAADLTERGAARVGAIRKGSARAGAAPLRDLSDEPFADIPGHLRTIGRRMHAPGGRGGRESPDGR